MGGKSSRTKERTNQYTYETQTDRLTGQIFGAFTSSFVHQKERSSSKRWSQKIGGWMRQALNGKPMLQPPPPPPQSRLLENRPAQEQTTSPPPPHTIYPVRYHLGRENNPLHQPVGASTPSKQPPLRPIDLRLIQGIYLTTLFDTHFFHRQLHHTLTPHISYTFSILLQPPIV